MTKKGIKSEIDMLINKEERNEYENKSLQMLCKKYIQLFDLLIDNTEYYLYYFYSIKTNIPKLEELCADRHIPENIKHKVVKQLNFYYKNDDPSNALNIIPKIIHLIYLNQRPLRSYNYLCINSIIKYMPDYTIMLHNDIELDNDPDWLSIKEKCIIKKVNRISEFNGIHISHVQYEADILRLQILYEYGGIYMDTDVFMFRNIDNLFTKGLYYCQESEGVLTNCILASNAGNEFLNILLNSFNTGLRMESWAWHIRDMPRILLEKSPYYYTKYNISLLDNKAFCSIHWTQSNLLNDPDFVITEDMYGLHLCETILGNKLDDSMFFKNIKENN